MKKNRKIALPNFYGEGKHIDEHPVVVPIEAKREAGSVVSREIFRVEVERIGFNLGFYYLDNDTFYGIHTEGDPIDCKILPRDRTKPYIGWQCNGDTHRDGEIIASFDEVEEIWDGLKIDGKSLEDVLERSYIMFLT